MAYGIPIRIFRLETPRNVGDARRRAELTALVVEIFADSDETYGYRRVHAELGRRGVPAGLELIRAIMRDQGLVPCQPRPWRASLTENDGTAGSIPDLVNRDFTADAPGEKMVGDITYSAQLAVMCRLVGGPRSAR